MMIMKYPYRLLQTLGGLLGVLWLCAAAPVPPALHRIDLDGIWRFAPEPADGVSCRQWASPGFDDGAWRELRSDAGWKQQGVEHSGFGWYRKWIDIPDDCRGIPLSLTFGEICYDDDVFFNGVRIGGLRGPYKYCNLISRLYAVPDSLIRFGEKNLVAVRAWGMLGEGVEGDRFGLASGRCEARFDPLQVQLRRTDRPGDRPCHPALFDLSDAQWGMTFEVIQHLDPSLPVAAGRSVIYRLSDLYGSELLKGKTSLVQTERGLPEVVIPVDSLTARRIGLAGRFLASSQVFGPGGELLAQRTDTVDHLSFAARDTMRLPECFQGVVHDTPYGRLRLVDEIDCAREVALDPHPYMQSGFDPRQQYATPGSPVEMNTPQILGRKARESGYGWFAYRIGRGKLKPHTCYLVRIEYPEDKPRYCPIEIQTGENYQNVAWRSGVSPQSPYDNWPLSGQWCWFDTIVPLDDETTGTSGANGASSLAGFWIYVMNKYNPPAYFPLFEGGPAVARIRLYELEERHLPVIRYPEAAPRRILMLDWERQPLMEPRDVVEYARQMGYNAVAPVIMKWAMMNYADPVPGYESYNDDSRGYWDKLVTPAGEMPRAAVPDRKSIHVRYLEATARTGMGYIPRIEYGGSELLPVEARAIDGEGNDAKPNRFAAWCGDLLHPATFADFSRLLDSLVGKYAARNPQLLGVLWRIRSDRMPISYSRADIEMFVRETGTTPSGTVSDRELARWASQGAAASAYTDWWHRKRAEFQGRVARLLDGYRPDLKLWFYNWDNDKFSLGMHDFTGWDFLGPAVRLAQKDPQRVREMYLRNIEKRDRYTTEDYLEMMRTGNLGVKSQGYLPHHGLRPWLYRDIPGVSLFAPINALYTARDSVFLNYFRTAEGLSVSNPVVYDEACSRFINPKFEGNMSIPAGAPFSMALELLSWFHGDARTLTYTTYTYARGFAAAHRRFAQAFLALPAICGECVDAGDPDTRIRIYRTPKAVYLGVASKSYVSKTIRVSVPLDKITPSGPVSVEDMVCGGKVPVDCTGKQLRFDIESGPMQLHAFRITEVNND